MIVINMTAFMFYHSDRLGGSLDSPLARAVFKPLYRMKWQRLIISMWGKDNFCLPSLVGRVHLSMSYLELIEPLK